MELFLFWIILSVIAGYFASTKGRSGFGWFLLSCVISPVITLILLAIFPAPQITSQTLEGQLAETERLLASGVITKEEYEARRKRLIAG